MAKKYKVAVPLAAAAVLALLLLLLWSTGSMGADTGKETKKNVFCLLLACSLLAVILTGCGQSS